MGRDGRHDSCSLQLLGFRCWGKWLLSPALLLSKIVVVNIAVAVITLSFKICFLQAPKVASFVVDVSDL